MVHNYKCDGAIKCLIKRESFNLAHTHYWDMIRNARLKITSTCAECRDLINTMSYRIISHPKWIESRKALTVALLCMINVLNYMDRYLIFGILSEIKLYFNLSNAEMGLLHTVFITVYIVSSFVFGIIGDWLSRKHTIIIGLVFWSICSFISSLPPENGYIMFYVCRSLIGVGEAAISTLGFTVIGDIYTGTARIRSLGFFLIALPVGSGLGYVIGPQMVTTKNVWQPALRITPGFGILFAILLGIFMKEPKRGEADMTARTETTSPLLSEPTSDTISEPPQHKSMLRMFVDDNLKYFYFRKSFILVTLGYSSISFVFGGLAIWVPNYLEEINSQLTNIPGHIQNPKLIGLLFGMATAFSGIIGVMVGGEITAFLRIRKRPIELYVCIFSCVSATITMYFCVYFSLSNLILTWIFMISTLSLLAISGSPNGDLIMLTVGPLHRSRASAIQIIVIHALGDAISPLIIGTISDHLKKQNSKGVTIIGLYYTLYITPFFLILGGLFYTLAILHYQKDYQSNIDETNELIQESIINALLIANENQ